MEVRVGWATDYGRSKFDVSMDEQDLKRILQEHGLDPGKAGKLYSSEVFLILNLEARRFTEWEALRMLPKDAITAEKKAKIEELKAQLKTKLATVKERLDDES